MVRRQRWSQVRIHHHRISCCGRTHPAHRSASRRGKEWGWGGGWGWGWGDTATLAVVEVVMGMAAALLVVETMGGSRT